MSENIHYIIFAIAGYGHIYKPVTLKKFKEVFSPNRCWLCWLVSY